MIFNFTAEIDRLKQEADDANKRVIALESIQNVCFALKLKAEEVRKEGSIVCINLSTSNGENIAEVDLKSFDKGIFKMIFHDEKDLGRFISPTMMMKILKTKMK